MAKQFLDPYDNENYGKGEDPLVVDTLIAETNAGSIRWMHGLDQMPISYQKIKDGDLSDALLPVRGYSVEELNLMMEEKKQLQEQREREEAERLAAEEKERIVQEAAASFPNYQFSVNDSELDLSEPYYVIYNNTGDRFNISWSLKEAPMATAEVINELMFSQNSNATSLQQELIPAGTASVSAYVEEVPEPPFVERKRIRFGGEEVDDDVDDFFHVSEDWGDDTNYVHLFQGFDPYGDLPSHDEIGPDGREIRLSQKLADEIWEEEIEYAKEKERAKIKTYEDYLQRAKELADEEELELLQTEEILLARANSEIGNFTVREESAKVPMYDQLKLDSVSQLFGLPPNELSEIPSYVEPPVESKSFDITAQLWDAGFSSGTTGQVSSELQESPGQFSDVEQLWGSQLNRLSSNGDPDTFVSLDDALSQDESVVSSPLPTQSVAGDEGRRLSQILADEVWEEELKNSQDEEEKPFTFEDYERQVQELLNAEKEELLETAAIMNARPGADEIEAPHLETEITESSNMTVASDDLSVLEMDAPLESTVISEDENIMEEDLISSDDAIATNATVPVNGEKILESTQED